MSSLLPRRLVVFVLAGALGLALVLVLSRASSAAPPEPDEVDMIVEDACDFPVHFEGSGKVKTIELSDGRTIEVAPSFRVTLTNLEEPDNQVTVHNTAAFHITPLPNGAALFVITGQILSWPPLELLVGRHTFLIDSEGNETLLSSAGQEIDLCARLD
jgi:hypothetical protein